MKVKVFKSIIEKYYLGGIVDTVKFTPTEDGVTIKFISPAKNLAGIINTSKISFGTQEEIAVFSTKKLLKMITIFKDEVDLKYSKSRLNMKDDRFDVNFSLCELQLVKPFPKNISSAEIPNFFIEADKDFISDFVTASKATDSEVFQLSIDKNGSPIFILGDIKNKYSDKIVLKAKSNPDLSSGMEFDSMTFNINEVEEILSANKNAIEYSNISIDGAGILKFYFSNEDYEATYYLVKNQE